MTTPHVFVSLGDLTHVECDAWMLPTDRGFRLEDHWTSDETGVSGLAEKIAGSKNELFKQGAELATEVLDWDLDRPLPVLTAVPFRGIRNEADLRELASAVRAFISLGATLAKDRESKHRRPKPLLAMPAFGTGKGGGGKIRGEVLETLLKSARDGAFENDVDVVIVLRDPQIFALAQQKRARDGWPELGPALIKKAQELAAFAREGKLVPFMGAGVSVSAGGPSWSELIQQLASGIEMSESETESLTRANRSALDQAAYLRERYLDRARESDVESGAEDFGVAIAAAVSVERYGLAPALLASLRTEQAITLNYDDLFERAASDAKDPRTVIPGATSKTVSNKWLLKLHGSVDDPASIVLTRDDYLGYNTTREALSAIVKANLITHHLMFVGFGLADDHFHQIIHDVRQSLPSDPSGPGYATAITMLADPLDATLWKGQLDLLPMEDPSPIETTTVSERIADAGRKLEIFLDALLVFATDSHSYLLDDDFASALSPGESSLREKLLALKTSANADEKDAAGWRLVEQMFEELGGLPQRK
ncbi:MAG: SIR2 family protein [Rhodoglobus sp.]